MLFNSISFLASFATFVVLYYALPLRFRWLVLLIASVGFYTTFNPIHVLVLLAVGGASYVAGRVLESSSDRGARKVCFAVGVAVIISPLLLFKYFDFIARSIAPLLVNLGVTRADTAVPLLNVGIAAGLSFYTLSCVSYLADVYAGRMAAERHAGYFVVYVSFFPKILAGPIERARPFLAQLRELHPFTAAGVVAGLQQMLWGLFKKVVIADRLALFVNDVFANVAFAQPVDLVLATYFFALQLYCDFSGYSDIAIGAARVLGFDLMENFRRPYLSTSISEFWAGRWHISLTSWFRDYVYIPFGGSRTSRLKHYRNVMVVFLLSGLWHGANWTFVVWGGLNGTYVVLSLLTARFRTRVVPAAFLTSPMHSLLAGLLTFHLVLISWVFFRAASLQDAVTVLTRVVTTPGQLPQMLAIRIRDTQILMSFLLIAVLFVFEVMEEKRPVWGRLETQPVYVRWTAYYALLLSLVVLGVWGFEQFVYMQF